jgi:phosphotransferase system enzyme I (PtsI)
VDAAHERGIWVGVCGEMAGEISLTPMLLGLGVDELSMGSVFVPRIKKAVQSLSYEECTNMVNDLMNNPSAHEIARRIEEHARYSYGELFE